MLIAGPIAGMAATSPSARGLAVSIPFGADAGPEGSGVRMRFR